MNVNLLKSIKRRILKEPRQFNMSYWFKTNKRVIPNCGTAACLGGWALTIGTKKGKPIVLAKQFGDAPLIGCISSSKIQPKAQELLDITSNQATDLFIWANWPSEFRGGFGSERDFDQADPKIRANLAAKRIDYFIEHGR